MGDNSQMFKLFMYMVCALVVVGLIAIGFLVSYIVMKG
jgi:hypothetical protein